MATRRAAAGPRIGELDHRVVIEAAVQSRTSEGEVVNGWAPVATVYAAIRPIRGEEKLQAGVSVESFDTVITVRWAQALADLTRGGVRLKHKTRIFDVKDIQPINYERRWIEFYATSGLNAG
jgi:SPP1 family predicted phage head-tail adaptor